MDSPLLRESDVETPHGNTRGRREGARTWSLCASGARSRTPCA